MALIWEKSGDAFYARATERAGEVRFHLIVERSGYHWDWAVWRPGESKSEARHGRTVTSYAAKWDAPRAPE